MMLSTQFISKINKHLASGLLFLFFLSEIYGKFIDRYADDTSDIVRFIKLITLLFFAIACIKQIRYIIGFFILFLFFIVGQATINNGFQPEILVTFSKYVFPLFLFLYFNTNPISTGNKKLFFKTFEVLILLNTVIIITAFVFDISVLSSYTGNRFGYNGIFRAASTGSYAYIIALMYFLLAYKSAVVKNWRFILILISCFFIGTKAVYLAQVFTLVYLIITVKIPHKKIILAGTATLSVFVGYFFFFRYGIFNSIRQSDGLISALLSYRDELFLERTLPYIQQNWNWINYLFGGVSNYDFRSQMELFDVFFFWGILGGTIYLILFFKLLITFKLNKTESVFISFLAIIVLLAGNFFVYSFVALLLLVLKLKLEENVKKGA